MVVLLVLAVFVTFLTIDWIKTRASRVWVPRGTMYTTPGFEMLGALAQDGGDPMPQEQNDWEI